MATNLIDLLPPMLFGEELRQKMTSLPEYKKEYRSLEPGRRLLQLTDIYKVFVAQTMAQEIYQKLYTMTVLSLKQKGTREAIMQANANFRWINGGEYKGVITGASSASVIGESGIGKTSCVQKSMEFLGGVFEIKETTYRKVIPAMIVTVPYDCSSKGLLGQILLCLDQVIGSDYFLQSQRERYNAQGLMSLVCELCLLHVGVLVLDEIQFITQHKSGTMIYRLILQLVNSSGISVMLVGTPESVDYLQQAPQIARRTTGLKYDNLEYGKEFRALAETMFRYQYIRHNTELTEGLLSWLYEHTAGNVGNLMTLFHDAQEIAINNGTERLDITALTSAYTKRMRMLHPYIEPGRMKLPPAGKRSRKKHKEGLPPISPVEPDILITDIVAKVKEQGMDVVQEFRKLIKVEEVTI